ncbi:hypothetical protein UYO_0155 [Lachnospiraceae bacterium JC7]|nr:hypothetical protein UYO_0155 [Lachnospiraceae bacterium JC7]
MKHGKTKRKILSILLSLVMVLGLMPGMSLTALAYDNNPYDSLVNTTTEITFDSKTWYLIEDDSTAANAGTVTLLAKECVGSSQYNANGSFVEYSNSTVKTAVDSWYTGNNIISADAKTAVSGSGMFLLTEDQATTIYNANPDVLKCSKADGADDNAWWLCSRAYFDYTAACVGGVSGRVNGADDEGFSVNGTLGVRPALKLDLSKVTFASVNLSGGANATSSGASYITNTFFLNGTVPAMTDVTYTADAGYTFPESSDLYKETNGITVAKTSDTVVTVSGTPTGVADITIPDAKQAATVTKAPTAKNLTYNGSAQELVTVGEASGGTMQYALGKDASTAPTDGWSADIPKGTDAKTYHVWYMAKGDNTHNDSAPGVVSVTIKENTSAHTHTIKLVGAKDPTCTEDGYDKHYECTECGKWFKDYGGHYLMTETEKAEITKKATGHKWDSGVVTVEPTYDETGIKTYTCSVCGEIKEETIPKKTRSYSNDSSDSGSSGDGSGSFSTQSLDVNGNAFGGPSAGHQPDSGMPVSDRGGNWGSIANNWSYTKSDGTLAKNEWLNLEYNGHTYWYFFDGNSTMQTDWLNYNGATYYFVPDMDGWCGRMATGWHQIGEKWYYFEQTAGAYQGVMYRGAVTPDGHIVGADGAWNGVGTTPESSAQTGTTASGT